MDTTIYHNPRCSKSRQTLALLRDRGGMPTVLEYLKQPPTQDEVLTLAKQLGLSVNELIRRKDKLCSELALPDVMNDTEAAAVIAEHPRLLERPIVVHGNKAAIGRPPENVLEIL